MQNVDYVFIPYNRAGGDSEKFLRLVGYTDFLFNSEISELCRNETKPVLCHYFLPPCGNSAVFELPTSVCEDTCNNLRSLCPFEWELARQLIEDGPNSAEKGFTMINCSNTGEYLPPSHCCEVPGIKNCKCNSVHPFNHNSEIYKKTTFRPQRHSCMTLH